MPRHCFPLVLAIQFLAACAAYHPAPLELNATARERAQRTPDTEAVRGELQRIAPAVAWDGQSWDRLSLLALALVANPRIAEARAHASSAEASASAARIGPPATLTLTAEYAKDAPESSPWLYGLTSDIPVDAGGRRAGRIGSADYGALAARFDYAETVWSVRGTLRQALVDQRLTSREIDSGEALSAVRVRQVEAVQARVAAGEVSRTELLRVQAEAAADARRLSAARARRIAADTAVAGALGISRAAAASLAVSWESFDDPAGGTSAAVPETGPEDTTALLVRPDVLQAAAAYDGAEADLRAEVARQWPEIHLGPGYIWERGLVKLPFSLGLVLPPRDLNRSAIAAAEARRLEAGVHLGALVSAAQLSISAAVSARAAAVVALAQVRQAELPAARAVASNADWELQAGAIDRVDWAASQAQLRAAELAEIDALRCVHASVAALEDALRRPLDGPEQALATGWASGGSADPGPKETM